MTISLLESCFINDVNLGDVIWMLDVLFSPPVHQLRKSVDLVVLPLEINLRLLFVAPLRAFMALA